MEQHTKQHIQAALAVTMAVAETVRELGETPAGPVYAAMMNRVSYQGFESLLRTLKNAGLVDRRGDMLVWVGPRL